MVRYYFKIAWRNLLKHKIFTLINVLGLTLGITACLIIYLDVRFELSYDNFHSDKTRIYRVVTKFEKKDAEPYFSGSVPDPAAPEIKRTFTGLDKIAQFHNYYAKVLVPEPGKASRLFDRQDGNEGPSDIIVTDPDYFRIFSYQWLAGSPTLLEAPFRVVISASKAQQYFGSLPAELVLGRTVIYNDSLVLRVAGIVRDMPANSDLPFRDFISSETIPVSFLKNGFGTTQWQMWDGSCQTFVKLARRTTAAQFDAQAVSLVKKNIPSTPGQKNAITLQPLANIHFNVLIPDHYGKRASLPVLYGLMGIALFILAIAAINFINLSTARSLERSREVGVHKLMGCTRSGIAWQLLTETLLVVLVATALSFAITQPLIRLFSQFLPAGVSLNLEPSTLCFVVMLVIATAGIAGIFPAHVLSRIGPVFALKGASLQLGDKRNYLRKGLSVFQFTLSLVFIISTGVIAQQLHFVLSSDLGFAKNAILTIPTSWDYHQGEKEVFAQAIREIPGVQRVSVDIGPPSDIEQNQFGTTIKVYGSRAEAIPAGMQTADENYLPLYKLSLLAGRNLQNSDTMREFIINETCARALGFKKPADALGQVLEIGRGNAHGMIKCPVVGVVRDFHSQDLYQSIAPVFIGESKPLSRVVSVKLSGDQQQIVQLPGTLAAIGAEWKKVFPNEKFTYRFFDQTIARFYQKDQKMSTLMRTATGITVFISCMGLFGLALFSTVRRTREIGIRRVLGASAEGIVAMLSMDFLKPVYFAILLASPIAWYGAHQWLQRFAYRVSPGLGLYLAAVSLAVFIALASVSYHAVRTALANPTDSLRSE